MSRSLLGFPASVSDSRLKVAFLDDNTNVPAGAAFNGGLAYHADGSLYYCALPTGGLAVQTTSYCNGMLVRGDGALVTAGNAPTNFHNGIGYLASTGATCNSIGAIASYANGIAFDANGGFCI